MDPELRLLHDLVSIPSPTGATQKCAEFLAGEMRGQGFDEAFVDEAGNAVGIAGRGPRELLLVGHLDTVPGELPVRFDERGHLWGRGSVDAKGALAAFVLAARRFAGRDDVRVVVVGCCDEEQESHGARHLIPRYRPEAVVIGEPSGTDGVTIGYKGIVKVRYALEEDLAHTGAPFPSVPDRGIAFWSALQGFLARQHGESLFTTPTVKLNRFDTREVAGGRVRVELEGSARIPPGYDSGALLDFLRAKAGRGVLEVPEVDPAWVSDKNSALARAFVASVRAAGLVPRYVKKTGTSDMNILAPAWQVPCIAYGPGDASLDHTPHERLAPGDLRRAVEVVGGALERMTAPTAPGGERRGQ